MDNRIYRDFTPAEYAGYEKYNGVMTFRNGDSTNGQVQFDEGCMWFGAIDEKLRHYETREAPTIYVGPVDPATGQATDAEGLGWAQYTFGEPCACALCGAPIGSGWANLATGETFCEYHISSEV